MEIRLLFKIVLWILSGAIFFYLTQAIRSDNWSVFKISEIKNIKDFLYFFFIVGFIPLVDLIVLSVPTYLLINKISKYVLLFILLIVQYFIWWALTSRELNDINLLIRILISCFIFILIFIVPKERL